MTISCVKRATACPSTSADLANYAMFAMLVAFASAEVDEVT
jgi:hypothetical protein